MSQTWTVSSLNRYIRTALETDYRLTDLAIEGEISNVSRPASGHLYFTLKDVASSLKCVMWKSQVIRMVYRPKDGDRVTVHGAIGVYEAGGQYQLYADWMQVAGEGDLFRLFNELKAALEAEGLFDPERKQALPKRPGKVAIVTSPSGAAVQDMLNVFRRRWPALEVVVCPTPVQGEAAPDQIVQALRAAEKLEPDLVIVARGGGSLEDLWCFNDERVVRAVADCGVPIISGVGHEIDFTLTDFAADVRAPTPSAAAELACPNRADFVADLAGFNYRLASALATKVQEKRWTLTARQVVLRSLSPRAKVANARQRLDDLSGRGLLALQHQLALERQRVTGLTDQLQALSPLAVLERGYAIVTQASSGKVVKAADQVTAGDALDVQVREGRFKVEVVERGKKSG